MAAPHGYVEKLAELSSAGQPFVAVTLVDTVGSTPQDVGTKMLVDQSGLVFGTVGGGRVENKAIQHAQALLTDSFSNACELIEWNLQRDVGMTCGGVVQLLFEAYNFREWRIVVFGAGHVAQALVRCLLLMECRIVCVDPRLDWLTKMPQSAKLVTVQFAEPREYVTQVASSDYVVCMTMGHRTDRPILQAIFEQSLSLPYLGVIGSQAKRKTLIRELIDGGVSRSAADAFRCPIGLPIGTNQPGEIAVSIVAELIQCRDNLKQQGSGN